MFLVWEEATVSQEDAASIPNAVYGKQEAQFSEEILHSNRYLTANNAKVLRKARNEQLCDLNKTAVNIQQKSLAFFVVNFTK